MSQEFSTPIKAEETQPIKTELEALISEFIARLERCEANMQAALNDIHNKESTHVEQLSVKEAESVIEKLNELKLEEPKQIEVKDCCHNPLVMNAAPTTFVYVPSFLDKKTATDYLQSIDAVVLYAKGLNYRGHPLPRDKAFYADFDKNGCHPLYRYTGFTYKTGIHPFPEVLKVIRDLIHQKTGQYCNHLVVNNYKNQKDYIGKHNDKNKDFVPGSNVITISFDTTRTLRLTHNESGQKIDIQLEHGSMFILDWVTNTNWEHEIIKERDERGRRLSLTFRSIKTMYDPKRRQIVA